MFKAVQEGRLFGTYISNTVIPDYDPVSPTFFGWEISLRWRYVFKK